jgi:hypothetical protein
VTVAPFNVVYQVLSVNPGPVSSPMYTSQRPALHDHGEFSVFWHRKVSVIMGRATG